jgi:hypothetical protein
MTPHTTVTSRSLSRGAHAHRAASEVLVARRRLDNGFIDAARRIFMRHPALVTPEDWTHLVTRLLERGRVADAVVACQAGGLPLPREPLLALGDEHVKRRDVQGAIRYYELAGADVERWASLVDLLARLPGHELHATEVARRHLIRDA